jgi:hypothetical protein
MINGGLGFSPSYDVASPPPLTPSPVSRLSLFLSLRVCRRPVELTDGRGGWRGVGEEPNQTTERKSCKSFSTLWNGKNCARTYGARKSYLNTCNLFTILFLLPFELIFINQMLPDVNSQEKHS